MTTEPAPLPLDGLPEAIAAAKSALKRNGFEDPLPYIAWKFAMTAAMEAAVQSAPPTPEGIDAPDLRGALADLGRTAHRWRKALDRIANGVGAKHSDAQRIAREALATPPQADAKATP